jgi:hypothetical protein
MTPEEVRQRFQAAVARGRAQAPASWCGFGPRPANLRRAGAVHAAGPRALSAATGWS